MFADLDFTYWQSYLVVFIVVFTFGLALLMSIACFAIFYMWLMQDFIARDIRNGKIKWLRRADEE